MALTSTVLFGTPQAEIAAILNQKITNAKRIKIVTGFATVEGMKALEKALTRNPFYLEVLVIGAGTFKAYEALDELIEKGVANQNLFVHLGHTRPSGSVKHPFSRYHPMLHSKIYYMENADGTACAFIGSHNITGFALKGLNGEASVLLEGSINDPEFDKVRNHIEIAKNQAVVYHTEMKEAYSWWANQFMEGLVLKTRDIPKDFEQTRTILVFCEAKTRNPKANEILYFELREAVAKVQSFSTPVHVFVFDILPQSPSECLANLHRVIQSFECSIEGIENNNGGKELIADWAIDNEFSPILQEASQPFRPPPKPQMQQIRVRLKNHVSHKYDYLFGKQNVNWLPILNKQESFNYDGAFSAVVEKLDMMHPETKEWFLVTGLKSADEPNVKAVSPYEKALKAMEPESGAFILFSTSRRELKANKIKEEML